MKRFVRITDLRGSLIEGNIYSEVIGVGADLNGFTNWQENTCNRSCVFSGPYSPAFGLNAEIYFVNLGIHSEYGKTQTRKFLFEHFHAVRIVLLESCALTFTFTKKSLHYECCLESLLKPSSLRLQGCKSCNTCRNIYF